jgi:hypothetical protein
VALCSGNADFSMTPKPDTSEPPIPHRYFLPWLDRILGLSSPRFLLIRTEDRRASAVLVAEFLDRRHGPGCVVVDADLPPPPYRLPVASTRAWRVVRSSDIPGSVDVTARSMGAAKALLLDRDNERIVRSLWLPPSVLAGYSSLPPSPEAVLVVDDWAALEADYLAVPPNELLWRPDSQELDRLFVDAFRVFSGSHLVLVTTRDSEILAGAADAILEVRPTNLVPGGVAARIVRDCLTDSSTFRV